jgi:FkbH-like protein
MNTIKCVVWDLDDTVWEGTLLEGDDLRLRPGVAEAMRGLDERGILNSVASRNDHTAAMEALERFGLADLVVAPQIGWGAKSASVRAIAAEINIATDTLAFVDDQPFERDEITHELPEVLCIDAADVATILGRAEMQPQFVTEDSRRRREMYVADAHRRRDEDTHAGPAGDFLASLDLRMTIAPATEDDLQRAQELTVRTNQLNATGYTYSYDELDALRTSSDHDLLVATLSDRYGSYGTIGLCLVQRGRSTWRLKLLLMSCRVMSRGVGGLLLGHVVNAARDAGVRLRAEFVPTERNRAMFITYKFAGFREVRHADGLTELEHVGEESLVPAHVDLRVLEAAGR